MLRTRLKSSVNAAGAPPFTSPSVRFVGLALKVEWPTSLACSTRWVMAMLALVVAAGVAAAVITKSPARRARPPSAVQSFLSLIPESPRSLSLSPSGLKPAHPAQADAPAKGCATLLSWDRCDGGARPAWHLAEISG